MNPIIVATDYSPAAGNALTYAAQLARLTGSKIILFNAYHLPVPVGEAMIPLPDNQKLVADNKARLEKIAQETSSTYGVPVEALSRTTLLLDDLEDLCKQYEDPLVVVGMRGESLERKIFGSMTSSVLREGKYPVLVVPAEAGFRDIAKILFACDYGSLSVLNQLRPLKDLALTFRARLQILHIEQRLALAEEEPSGTKKSKRPDGPKLESIFRGIRHTYKEVESEDIIEGIEKGIKEYHADMLVMVPHKLGFWDYMLNRSNTRTMALRTHIPLLALPNPGFL